MTAPVCGVQSERRWVIEIDGGDGVIEKEAAHTHTC